MANGGQLKGEMAERPPETIEASATWTEDPFLLADSLRLKPRHHHPAASGGPEGVVSSAAATGGPEGLASVAEGNDGTGGVAWVAASGGPEGVVTAGVMPGLFNESMSHAFAENLRRFVRFLPPETAQEVLAEPSEAGSEQQYQGRYSTEDEGGFKVLKLF